MSHRLLPVGVPATPATSQRTEISFAVSEIVMSSDDTTSHVPPPEWKDVLPTTVPSTRTWPRISEAVLPRQNACSWTEWRRKGNKYLWYWASKVRVCMALEKTMLLSPKGTYAAVAFCCVCAPAEAVQPSRAVVVDQ